MICLELLGMSRAGKTTQRRMLSEQLYSEGAVVKTIERPKIPFNDFGSTYNFHNYLLDFFNKKINENQNGDVLILDRGPNDRGVLLQLDYQKGGLSPAQYEGLSRKAQELSCKIDKGFVFMVSPEESIKRWISQKNDGLDFSYLNTGLPSGDDEDSLRFLYNRYSSLIGSSHIQMIDGTNSINSNFNKIFRGITENAK